MMQKGINVAMTPCIKRWMEIVEKKGLVNISRLPKSVWPNLRYVRIYFNAKKRNPIYPAANSNLVKEKKLNKNSYY